jgi:hypothetical protein
MSGKYLKQVRKNALASLRFVAQCEHLSVYASSISQGPYPKGPLRYRISSLSSSSSMTVALNGRLFDTGSISGDAGSQGLMVEVDQRVPK